MLLDFDFRRGGERTYTPREKQIIEKYEIENIEQSQIVFEAPWLPTVPIIAIVGASGIGKSTLAAKLGFSSPPALDAERSAIEQFDALSDAEERLGALGFRSIPAWLTPVKNLSVGERWRVEVAAAIANNIVLDEFSSVVDRRLAKNMSTSLRRYVDRHKLQNVCVVTCHRDFFDELKPELIIDLDERCVFRRVEDPPTSQKKFMVQQCPREEWSFFLPITT